MQETGEQKGDSLTKQRPRAANAVSFAVTSGEKPKTLALQSGTTGLSEKSRCIFLVFHAKTRPDFSHNPAHKDIHPHHYYLTQPSAMKGGKNPLEKDELLLFTADMVKLKKGPKDSTKTPLEARQNQ